MRELKFKAYHKSGIVYWFDLMWGNYSQGNGYIGMVEWGKQPSEHGYRNNVILIDPNNCDIVQYTGLKDRNGTEIYEGDTINIKGRNYSYNAKIIWCESCGCFDIVSDDLPDYLNDMKELFTDRIGQITNLGVI